MTDEIKTAGSVMPDLLEQMPSVPIEVRRTARPIADVVGESMWASGKRPMSMASSCLYLAELIYDRDDRLSQTDFNAEGTTSYATIRKYYRDIPQVFVENATEDDVARFHDPSFVMERLATFIEAEQHPDPDIGIWNYERLEDGS